jgi:hypothetical protein
MGAQRTRVAISAEEKSWLESYSKARGISMAEAIHKAIARLREQEGQSTYQDLIAQTQGIWKKGDGLEYQVKLRSEWE